MMQSSWSGFDGIAMMVLMICRCFTTLFLILVRACSQKLIHHPAGRPSFAPNPLTYLHSLAAQP